MKIDLEYFFDIPKTEFSSAFHSKVECKCDISTTMQNELFIKQNRDDFFLENSVFICKYMERFS